MTNLHPTDDDGRCPGGDACYIIEADGSRKPKHCTTCHRDWVKGNHPIGTDCLMGPEALRENQKRNDAFFDTPEERARTWLNENLGSDRWSSQRLVSLTELLVEVEEAARVDERMPDRSEDSRHGLVEEAMTYSITPILGFDWPRFAISNQDRMFGRFATRAEADAYLAKVSRPPATPGYDPELHAMAEEAAALLRLRSDFNWKKKKNPEPEPVMPRFDDSEEFAF